MKSNKGITIISLIVYVIALSALIGTISMLQSYFYKNVDIINDSDRATEQDARISAYITDDVNSGKINKSKVAVENNRITIGFKDESIHQYVYENNNVYYITNIHFCHLKIMLLFISIYIIVLAPSVLILSAHAN